MFFVEYNQKRSFSLGKYQVKSRVKFLLQVGWTSNNHGGGFVRLALVPESEVNNREAYKRNVLKFTCYGHDQRPGRYAYGDCKHPCNARPGCEYQSGMY